MQYRLFVHNPYENDRYSNRSVQAAREGAVYHAEQEVMRLLHSVDGGVQAPTLYDAVTDVGVRREDFETSLYELEAKRAISIEGNLIRIA